MKKAVFLTVFLMSFSVLAFAQVNQIVGKWKTIDDADGSEKSIVHIYKASNGKYYGKIEHLFKNADKLCTECTDGNKNKPILGMVVLNGMVEKKGSLTGGTILDPNNGKTYRCNISLDGKTGNLLVRGSLDKAGILGRTQSWVREK